MQNTQNTTKRLTVWAAVVVGILMIPLVAMQVSSEWNWGFFDFVFMFIIMFGSALVYELVARKMSDKTYRFAVGIAVVAALLLVYINAAVGIIGEGDLDSPSAMYPLLLLSGFAAAFIVRFKPHGLARVLFSMAVAQALIPVIALFILDPGTWGHPGVFGVFVLNSIFAASWIVSALLFRRAGITASKLNPTA